MVGPRTSCGILGAAIGPGHKVEGDELGVLGAAEEVAAVALAATKKETIVVF